MSCPCNAGDTLINTYYDADAGSLLSSRTISSDMMQFAGRDDELKGHEVHVGVWYLTACHELACNLEAQHNLL